MMAVARGNETARAEAMPWVTRLSALAPLSAAEIEDLERCKPDRTLPSHRDIALQREAAGPLRLVISGWAATIREFRDGRRQILGLLLPGEIVNPHGQRTPSNLATTIALTEIALAIAPSARGDSALGRAYQVSANLQDAYLLSQITRLGRMDAYERLADLLLELRDRAALAGLARGDSFPLPLTQDLIGDTLGLTSVHVNRTLQLMRREGILDLRSGRATLLQPEKLAAATDYRPATSLL